MKKIITICIISVMVYACKQEITITAPTNFIYSVANSTINKGTIGNSVIPTINNGGGSIKYTFSGIAVSGLSINTSTGVISWTSALAIGTYNISILASNSVGSITAIYTLVVNNNGAVTAPASFLYSPASSTIVVGTVGSSAIPTISDGGAAVSYDLIGNIPAGISIDNKTGVISWNATVAVGNYTLSAKATNSVGNITTSYSLSVNASIVVTAPSSLLYNPASSSVTQGTAGNSVSPSINTGLGTITYSLTGTVVSGISIDVNSGVISWSSTVVTGTYNLTITATNSVGSTTATYVLTVNTAAATVSFSASILPVITSSCSGCHSYAKDYAGISSHTTGCSSIQDKIGTTYCTGVRMPQGGNPLSASFIALFNTWIAQGQLNN